MCQHTEIVYSIYEAAANKTSRPYVRNVLNNPDEKADKIQAKFINGTCHLPKHNKTHVIQESPNRKKRVINKPVWDDEQIIHHCLMRQFVPIIQPKLYKHVYGSIPGKGPLGAAKTMQRWVREYRGRKFYVLEADVQKFYDNIDKDILKGLLSKTIRDKRYLELLFQVIDCVEKGLPKGFYTSPWLANFYMIAVDMYVLHVLKPDHYLRYMDNIWFFGRNKKELHKKFIQFEEFIYKERKLKINANWQLFRFEYVDRVTKKTRGRHINCLGFVIHHNRVTIRKTILKRARAKANKMKKHNRCRTMDARSIMSYHGYFKHTNTKRYYMKHILSKVSLKYCKYRIAKDSRKRAIINARLACGT